MRIKSKVIEAKPNYLDAVFYFVIMAACYFFFNQADLIHTGGSSFAYLNGHIRDFYDANAKISGGSNYLPSTYIIYAVWNLPLKLLGIVTQARGTYNIGYVIFWYKLLTTLFFAGSAYFMYRIGRAIGLNRTNSKLLTAIWVSSPILFFSQFIFGQNDIFCAFFVLAGLFYYLRKNIWLFLLFFGISFTFKYFPLYMFVPLLLLIEKRPFELFSYSVLAFIPVIVEILLYSHSPAFQTGVGGFSALSYLYYLRVGVEPHVGWYPFLAIWFTLCAVCYCREPFEDKPAFYQASLYACLVIVSCSFMLMWWHPQWLLFVTPFLAITTFMSKKIKTFLFLDFIMMAAFVGVVAIAFQMNVDQHLFKFGILAGHNPQLFDPKYAFRMADIFTLGDKNDNISKVNTYFSLLTAILIANIMLKYPNKGNAWNGDAGIRPVKEYWSYARLRFFGGIALFVVPAFIVYFWTLKVPPQDGIANASSECNYCLARRAFDNDRDTYWIGAGEPLFLKYGFPEAKVIRRYAIVARLGEPVSCPVSWTMQGSNDDTKWVTLDARTKQKFAPGEAKEFLLNNKVAYKYYKMDITETSDNNYCLISELVLME